MKRKRMRMNRVLSLSLILALMISIVPVRTAFALTNDTQIINVEWENPTEIVAMEQQEQQFIVSTKTNNGRVNNFYFTFPADGGVRFHADNEGVFKPEELSAIDCVTDGEAIIMSANGTTVKLYDKANPWRFEVYNEKKMQVVSYDANHISLGYDETGAMRKVKIVNAVSEDETLFGLGERFNGFVQNGKTVEMWNVDSFSQLAKSYGDHNVGYKNIPLLHSNEGYSVFHNNTYYGIVDVAESNVNECSFEFYGPILDMYIWTDSAEKNIGHYLELTGNTVLVPKWGLSYWAGQSWSMWSREGDSLEDISEQVLPRLDRYDELQTPIKNIYLEGVGDNKKYLDLTENLMERGVHVFAWMNSTSYIPGEWEANREYPYVKWFYPDGTAWWDEKDGDHWIDFTDPAAMNWAYKRFEPFLGKGLYGTMLDFNDRIDVNAYYPYNGGTGDWMHNFSCYYYHKTVGETFKNYYGEGGYITFARAACAGSQKYTAFFGGDQTADFLGLQESVSALLSGAASGINIWGSDIGGLGMSEGNDPEVYARWLEFGTFSPLMRTHGQINWRDPWAYDKNGSSEALFQRYYWTRENLVDMIYSATIKSNKENIPLTKTMVVAYPEEKDMAANGSQYLFCDNLLVAPVTEEGATYQTVQFPEGRWVDLWNGEVYAGGQTIDVSASLDTIPVFIEAGSAFPVTFGETLDIGTMNTADKNVSALMVTPATKRKENKIYVSTEETQNFVCDISGENIYTVTAEEESDKRIVVAMGCTADHVNVDDKELEELSGKPTSASTAVGYYRDMENNATIIVTDGSWNSITYGDSGESLVNLAQGAEVTAEGLSEKETEKRQIIVDGKYIESLRFGKSEDAAVTIDLKKQAEINRILVKWGGTYAKSYTLEASKDGETWDTVFEKENGGGGTDTITFDKLKSYRYLRISGVDSKGKLQAELVEVEVYGNETAVSDVMEKKTDEVKEKPVIVMWIVIGIVLVAAVAAIVIVLQKRRKKNQKNEEEAPKKE